MCVCVWRGGWGGGGGRKEGGGGEGEGMIWWGGGGGGWRVGENEMLFYMTCSLNLGYLTCLPLSKIKQTRRENDKININNKKIYI